MERAFNAKAPYVLDVVIDPKAIPPISWFDDFNPETIEN
jgi:thiamine pyrophosphate-dependent acetolactate synthase large subunit-like protein